MLQNHVTKIIIYHFGKKDLVLKMAYPDCKERLKAKDQVIEALKRQLQNTTKSFVDDQAERHFQQMKSEIIRLQNENKQLQADLAKNVSESESTFAENSDLTVKFEELDKAYFKVNVERDKLEKELKLITEELDQARNEISDLRAENVDLEHNNNELRSRIKKIKESLETLGINITV